MDTPVIFHRPGTRTRPVVEWPDSVTHWTCPDAQVPGDTHHLIFPSQRCLTCGRGRRDLAEIQKRMNADVLDEAGRVVCQLWQVRSWDREFLYWESGEHHRRTVITKAERERLFALLRGGRR